MHITNNSIHLPRRTFLRGLGAAISLPLLECMLPGVAKAAAAAAKAGTSPKRLIFVYLPNGMHMAAFTPKGTGLSDLPETLAPLAEHRSHLQVLSGLAHAQARPLGDGAGDHARANACFLTGVHPHKTAGADIKAGISVDQMVAQAIGKETRLGSLELSCDNAGQLVGACDSGYACAYQNNISWRNDTTPLPPMFDPRLVFERLFGAAEDPALAAGRALRESCRKSILDVVREDARALQARLGATDRRKMDEYLTALRETEVAVEQNAKFKATVAIPEMNKPEGIPSDLTERIRLMYDLLALAMQTDATRVATMMVQREGSNRPYPWIGVSDGHHDLSHHGGSAEKQAKIAAINRYHVEQFAYFLDKLKLMREGSGSVLDNSMIVFGSGLADGNAHAHEDLPVILAGGGGGTLRGNRHVRFDRETPMTNLYLSLMDRMGVQADRFGDSTGKLKNI
ncbi:MAG TPA: DUF1552 domain-containing protein [Chthoniobacteraceae bacterium]|jgi:hypothetical protein